MEENLTKMCLLVVWKTELESNELRYLTEIYKVLKV